MNSYLKYVLIITIIITTIIITHKSIHENKNKDLISCFGCLHKKMTIIIKVNESWNKKIISENLINLWHT